MTTKPDDIPIRAISRHSVAYLLNSIGEILHHYKFNPLDVLILYTILHANSLKVIKDPTLDRKYGDYDTLEPDDIKQGISRSAVARYLNVPFETVRRRVETMIQKGLLTETRRGLIITQMNEYRLGSNYDIQRLNIRLLRRFLRDLSRLGIDSYEDL
ncbi:hypothetical protein [Bradyrhizobium sp. STM 3809]|uniref:hypothetical protein n=1 Tax=Bradyrhizobium sp. STM 3809 TaxID=551936 RepID=UPI000240932B|nr:hypothetical protein [Bradyrhizobium sp. STM 3809]CCE01192.1 conserved hypothetical protein [Bradyrhizobium sp. STM 3809]